MPGVNADPEKLRQLAVQLSSTAEQCEQISRQLLRSLEATGWKDSERDRFEATLKAALRQVTKAGDQMKSDLAPQLRRKATALDQFRA